jgi:2-phosphosulfolactate phosphatase
VSRPGLSLRWRTDGEEVEADSIAIVVDVLRASTTITTALAGGAAEIAVTRAVEEALALARESGGLLVGERANRKIEGFDFCSSPTEIDEQDLAGKRVVFNSPNFPHALHAARRARRILAGAVVNVSAVAARAADLAERAGADIQIMLAGEPVEAHAFEDYFFAGSAAALLADRCLLDGSAQRAASEAGGLSPDEAAARSLHAAELFADGFGRDVRFALQRDRFRVVPVFEGGVFRPGQAIDG